ncbi:hypothetical protein I0641_000111 [Staphylococcus pseudintermedius]|nr:hypothetical protein [Staphylococcus pseudintermedius]
MKFNENKISELINKFNKLELTYLDHSSFDMIETEFNFYYDLFSELVTPVLQKIRNKYGEDVSDKIIFSHFAIENNKFYLAFYDPFLYVDLEGYLNNTEMIIKKLVEETEK